MEIILITTENCPMCKTLRKYMDDNGIEFKVDEITGSAEDRTRLMVDYGFFGISLPALKVGRKIHLAGDLFYENGNVKEWVKTLKRTNEVDKHE